MNLKCFFENTCPGNGRSNFSVNHKMIFLLHFLILIVQKVIGHSPRCQATYRDGVPHRFAACLQEIYTVAVCLSLLLQEEEIKQIGFVVQDV